MGRGYKLNGPEFTMGAATAQTLITLAAPSDAIVIVDRIEVGQAGYTTQELLAMHIGKAASQGTGTSADIDAVETGHPAFGGTGNVDHSAEPSTPNPIIKAVWNILAPFEWLRLTSEAELVLSPSEILYVRLDDNPGQALNVVPLIEFREIGG